MDSTTLADFRAALEERIDRLAPNQSDTLREELAVAAEDALVDEEELLLVDTWEVFAPIANLFTGHGVDDEVFGSFLNVWAGPHAEEQFLDRFEWESALADGSFPDELQAVMESAERVFILEYDPPAEHAALFSAEWGWVIAYPDRLLRFRTPVDLLDFMIREQAGRG